MKNDNIEVWQVPMRSSGAEQIEAMMRDCGMASHDQFLNAAVNLMDIAIEQKKLGRELGFVDREKGIFYVFEVKALAKVKRS